MESIELIINVITDSLRRWYALHTDRVEWADDWLAGYEPSEFIREFPTIGNSFFSFNLAETAYARYLVSMCSVCSECGLIIDNGFGCPNCGEECSEDELTLDYALDYVQDTGYVVESIPDYIITETLENEGFDVYHAGVYDTVAGIIDEVETALDRINNAENNVELLSCAMSALSIMHHSGNIFGDYAGLFGLSYGTINSIRNEGLESIFTRDEIREFITEN